MHKAAMASGMASERGTTAMKSEGNGHSCMVTALTKRGRIKQESKRQRRASETIPPISRTGTLEEESDDDDSGNPMSRAKKARADAVQSARQAEQREKDKEREKARAEAAGRRQERAGRRRGDGETFPSVTQYCTDADPRRRTRA